MNAVTSYTIMRQKAVEGRDFLIDLRRTTSTYAIMAPHGGRIEPATDIIAEAIAGTDHSFYALKGMLSSGNRRLHLSSLDFDEPKALNLIKQVHTIVTVHGCRGEVPKIYVGGLDTVLAHRITTHLRAFKFPVAQPIPHALKGVNPNNLCNRGRLKKGIQLELSLGLRQQLMHPQNGMAKHSSLQRFASVLRTSLKSI